MKQFFLPGFAAVTILLAAISIVRTRPQIESTDPPLAPPRSPFQHRVAAVGLVEPSTEDIAIGTHLPGVVSIVHVSAGQSVTNGQPLFGIDARHLQAQLAAQTAQWKAAASRAAVAAAALEDLRQQLQFAERLPDPRAISAEELTGRRSAVSTARAQLEAAQAEAASMEAQVRVIETEIDRSTVRSPLEGQVLQIKIRPGEYAAHGSARQPFIILGRVDPLHVRVDIDEHEAWRVLPDAPAVAQVRGNARLSAPLVFVRFEPYVIPKESLTGSSMERVDTRVLQALYRIEGGDLRLFAGQQMDVFIEAEPIPEIAARTDPGLRVSR